MTPQTFQGFTGGVLTLVISGSLGWTAYVIAVAVLPAASPATRTAAALTVFAWLAILLFWILGAWGGFRPVVLIPVTVGFALSVSRLRPGHPPPGRTLLEDVRGIGRFLVAMARRPAGWALAALLLAATIRLLRGTIAPPLGWDALTYHLVHAGRWVQAGGPAFLQAPDAWQYYGYFPVVGDVYWAWAMLPFRNALLVPAAGTLIWGTALLGIYACGRELGAARNDAAWAATAFGAMPATLGYLSSAYVDNTTLALFVLGALFTVRVLVQGRIREAPLAAGAFALMVGTKLTAAPLFVVGVLFIVPVILRTESERHLRWWALVACGVAVLPGALGYVRPWIEQGSPLYPFHLTFGSLVVSEGAEAIGRNALVRADWYQLKSALHFWRLFLFDPASDGSFLNPGPAAVLLPLLAIASLRTLRRDPPRVLAKAFLWVSSLAVLGVFLSPNMYYARETLGVMTAGRYVLPGFAAAAILGTTVNGRWRRVIWGATFLTGLVLARPRAWDAMEIFPVAVTGGLLLTVGFGFSAVLRHAWPSRLIPAASVLLLGGFAGAALEPLRDVYRYPIYAAAGRPEDELYHMHHLRTSSTLAWPIWRALDEPGGYRIAAVAGWDGHGHNWYWYPLLGSRLQNRLFYVPITRSGEIVDYATRDVVEERKDFQSWLQRLVDERIDFVVSLHPRNTPEDEWMTKHPEIFTPEFAAPRNYHVAFRIDRSAARRRLPTDPPRS